MKLKIPNWFINMIFFLLWLTYINSFFHIFLYFLNFSNSILCDTIHFNFSSYVSENPTNTIIIINMKDNINTLLWWIYAKHCVRYFVKHCFQILTILETPFPPFLSLQLSLFSWSLFAFLILEDIEKLILYLCDSSVICYLAFVFLS